MKTSPGGVTSCRVTIGLGGGGVTLPVTGEPTPTEGTLGVPRALCPTGGTPGIPGDAPADPGIPTADEPTVLGALTDWGKPKGGIPAETGEPRDVIVGICTWETSVFTGVFADRGLTAGWLDGLWGAMVVDTTGWLEVEDVIKDGRGAGGAIPPVKLRSNLCVTAKKKSIKTNLLFSILICFTTQRKNTSLIKS